MGIIGCWREATREEPAIIVMDGGQQFDLESCHEGYALMSLVFRSPPWRRFGKPFLEASVKPNTKKWHHLQEHQKLKTETEAANRHGSGMKTNYWLAFWKN